MPFGLMYYVFSTCTCMLLDFNGFHGLLSILWHKWTRVFSDLRFYVWKSWVYSFTIVYLSLPLREQGKEGCVTTLKMAARETIVCTARGITDNRIQSNASHQSFDCILSNQMHNKILSIELSLNGTNSKLDDLFRQTKWRIRMPWRDMSKCLELKSPDWYKYVLEG